MITRLSRKEVRMRKLVVLMAATLVALNAGCVASDLSNIATFITAIGAVDIIRTWLATL